MIPETPEPEEVVQKPVMSINQQSNNKLSSVLTKNKKIVSFVGSTKNGTSFIVNNLALVLSSMNISTAILDVTHSKNAYVLVFLCPNKCKLRYFREF